LNLDAGAHADDEEAAVPGPSAGASTGVAVHARLGEVRAPERSWRAAANGKRTGDIMVITEALRKLLVASRRLEGESGQALVEYALLLSLIAIVCFGVVSAMGLSLSSLYNTINTRFP
jgi:Flp pilus assembly pilin Flp